MLRTHSLVLVFALGLSGTFLVAACLFPSFDDFDKGEGGSSSGTSGSTGSSSGSSGTSGTNGDGGSSGGERDAASDGGEGLTFCAGDFCVNGVTFCCIRLVGDTSCVPENDKSTCDAITDTFIRCDDRNDCPAGQVCCQNSFGEDTECQVSCDSDDFLLCRTNAGCPEGMTCSQQRGSGYLACKKN